MKQRKLLTRFQCHLFWQMLLRSVLWGLTTAGVTIMALSVIGHFKLKAPEAAQMLLWGGCGFAVGFMPCVCLFFPTKRRTARALDRIGLQERAGTMLAFEKEEGLLVQLQRSDAAEHIKKTSAAKIWMRIRLVEVLAFLVSAALCVAVMQVPYDLLAPPPPPEVKQPEISPWEKELHSKIDALREQLRERELAAETLAELEAILDQLEQDLLEADTELEQAALVQDAQEQMQDILWNTISRRIIGRALQQYDLTTPLGAKLCLDTEYWEITEEMTQMKEDISGPTKQLQRLSNNIKNALEISGAPESDTLYIALSEFGDGLYDMSVYTIGPDNEPGWTMSDLDFLFETAEEKIRSALEEQAHNESEVAEMDGLISSSLQSIVGDEGSEVAPQLSGSQKPGGGGNSAPQGGGDGNSSGTPAGGMFDSGDDGSVRTTMLEGVYDPMSGSVAYGDVFAVYYAEYLKALDSGDIPEELRDYFERYFSSLS